MNDGCVAQAERDWPAMPNLGDNCWDASPNSRCGSKFDTGPDKRRDYSNLALLCCHSPCTATWLSHAQWSVRRACMQMQVRQGTRCCANSRNTVKYSVLAAAVESQRTIRRPVGAAARLWIRLEEGIGTVRAFGRCPAASQLTPSGRAASA